MPFKICPLCELSKKDETFDKVRQHFGCKQQGQKNLYFVYTANMDKIPYGNIIF